MNITHLPTFPISSPHNSAVIVVCLPPRVCPVGGYYGKARAPTFHVRYHTKRSLMGKKRVLEGAARRLSGWSGQFKLAEDEGGDRSEDWSLGNHGNMNLRKISTSTSDGRGEMVMTKAMCHTNPNLPSTSSLPTCS
jgi:hypothetical protein